MVVLVVVVTSMKNVRQPYEEKRQNRNFLLTLSHAFLGGAGGGVVRFVC